MKVIRPLEEYIAPTIFLAGPIQSAPDWHSDAISYLNQMHNMLNHTDDYCIASPKMLDKPEEFYYEKQVNWESKHLKQAAETGVILFWLAKPIESQLDPTRSYAQTTRFEIAEWFGKKILDSKIEIVVGIEPGFHGERYIIQRFKNDLGIDVCTTLRDTCANAYYLLKQKGA